jgi:hypothetical protein
MSKVYIFHGDKGGVGKSFAASTYADYLNTKDGYDNVIIVDGDTRNPDVDRTFSQFNKCFRFDLKNESGWMSLIDTIEDFPDKNIIISFPAGAGEFFALHSNNFKNALEIFGKKIIIFWVINRLPDSINLLKHSLVELNDISEKIIVIRNLFFGDKELFGRWNDSRTKKDFLESGGIEIDMPDLHYRIIDKICTLKPIPLSKNIEGSTLKVSERMPLESFISTMKEQFDKI